VTAGINPVTVTKIKARSRRRVGPVKKFRAIVESGYSYSKTEFIFPFEILMRLEECYRMKAHASSVDWLVGTGVRILSRRAPMHRKLSFILGVICMLMLLPHAGCAEEEAKFSTIEVVGRASITVMPDIATISFAVETNAVKAQQAVRENAERTDRLLHALRDITKQRTKVSTSGFTLNPVYDKEDRYRPRGYRVTNTVVLKTKDIKKVGTFIDEASKVGVSRIGSLTFGTDREQQLKKEAAVQAVNQAKSIAKDLAKTAGLAIRKIVKLNYAPRGPVRPYRMEAMVAAARTPIEVGELTVEESVRVVFEAD